MIIFSFVKFIYIFNCAGFHSPDFCFEHANTNSCTNFMASDGKCLYGHFVFYILSFVIFIVIDLFIDYDVSVAIFYGFAILTAEICRSN